MEYVAMVNGKFSCSDGALVHCDCNQLYWVGWDTCPNCGLSKYKIGLNEDNKNVEPVQETEGS